MLLPALEAWGAGSDVRAIAVLRPNPGARGLKPELMGLFVLERLARYRNLKLAAWTLWRYPHGYLCTPLVRAECAKQCLHALFEWLRTHDPEASLLELPWIAGDGPLHEILSELLSDLGLPGFIFEAFTRGIWRSPEDASCTLDVTVSTQLRRQMRRKGRRLAERGRVAHRRLERGADIDRWIAEFLELEAGGWKGRSGSALACTARGRRYFEEVATTAFHRERLMMLGLDLDGRPIARCCAFTAGIGAFAFKTAYDEQFARYSPGTMLGLDWISELHALTGVQWMDSCAAPDSAFVNRLTTHRKTIQSLVVGLSGVGELVVSGWALVRWANRRIADLGDAERLLDAADPRRASAANESGSVRS